MCLSHQHTVQDQRSYWRRRFQSITKTTCAYILQVFWEDYWLQMLVRLLPSSSFASHKLSASCTCSWPASCNEHSATLCCQEHVSRNGLWEWFTSIVLAAVGREWQGGRLQLWLAIIDYGQWRDGIIHSNSCSLLTNFNQLVEMESHSASAMVTNLCWLRSVLT